MENLFYAVQIYLGCFAAVKTYRDFRTKHRLWNVVLFAMTILAIIFSIYYQYVDSHNKREAQEIASRRVDSKLDALGSTGERTLEAITKDKRIMPSDVSLTYIFHYLENVDRSLSRISQSFHRDFILEYFNEVDKIPNYFNLDEWKSTELVIYQHKIDSITGYLNSNGMLRSPAREELIKALETERTRILKAKERSFLNQNN